MTPLGFWFTEKYTWYSVRSSNKRRISLFFR